MLVVGEVAEGFVDQAGELAEEHERPPAAGNEEHAFAVQRGNGLHELRGVAVLCILRPEGARFFMVDHELDKLHEVADIEHGTPVLHGGEEGELARQSGKQREVALTAFAIDHGRAEDADAESGILELPETDFGLHLTVAVEIGGGDGGVAGDVLGLADGSTVAIDDGAAHEDELRNAVCLGFGCGFDGEVGVDFVVEGFALVTDVAGVGVGNARNVVHGIVPGEAGVAPAAVNHVEGGDAVLLRPLREVVLKGCADVAVCTCDEDFFHGLMMLPVGLMYDLYDTRVQGARLYSVPILHSPCRVELAPMRQ